MPSVTDKTSKAEIIELFKNHVSSGKARVFTSFGRYEFLLPGKIKR